VSEDNSGRWALKNVERGYFLGSSSDKLTCTAKVPGDAELWHVHLAARPQVNLRSIGRKRFAHLSESLDEIHVDANVPWGEDTLFTLEFRADEGGKYALHTCNNKYLSACGKLQDTCTSNCLFSAEYHAGSLALRDGSGAYLAPIGSKAVLKTRSTAVTRDELFSLEDSLPQAAVMFVLASILPERKLLCSHVASLLSGVDVTANQDEISSHETFQLEFDWATRRWYIRTMQDRYWTLETGGGIQASDGAVAFRANNGKYLMTKRSGHLYANADGVDDNCKYYFYLINSDTSDFSLLHSFLIFVLLFQAYSGAEVRAGLRGPQGSAARVQQGQLRDHPGQNGKYWHADSESVTCDAESPQGFHLELREPTRLAIRAAAGHDYLAAAKNGNFHLNGSDIAKATHWEY
ncbi:Fascin, partial [Operophtera brumata]